MSHPLLRRALVPLALAAVLATGCSEDEPAGAPEATTTSEAPTSSTNSTVADDATDDTVPGECPEDEVCIEWAPPVTTPEFVAYAEAADAVCLSYLPRFESLPTGDDPSRPLGMGALMRDVADELAALPAPPEVADDLASALEAFGALGDLHAEAEALAAAGDLEAAGEVDGEASWERSPAVMQQIASLGVPFEVCFQEE